MSRQPTQRTRPNAARGGEGEGEEKFSARELGKKYMDSAAEEAKSQTVDYIKDTVKDTMQPMLDDVQGQVDDAKDAALQQIDDVKEQAIAEAQAAKERAQLDEKKQQAQDELNAEKQRAQAAIEDAKDILSLNQMWLRAIEHWLCSHDWTTEVRPQTYFCVHPYIRSPGCFFGSISFVSLGFTLQNMIISNYSLPGHSTLLGMTLVFKKYQPRIIPSLPGTTSIALVLAHSIGTHKETWEPVIEHLFQFQASNSPGVIIIEVWSADSPNHGEAAAINENFFSSGWMEFGTIHDRLSPRRPPLIVHDPCRADDDDEGDFSAIVRGFKRILAAVKKRTNIWSSREIARAWFQQRLPWRRWDARTLDSLMKYGLRDLPTAAHPERADGVTLACTRKQEATGYMYDQDGVDANERLRLLCARLPVHCIFGAEITPEETRRGICDAAQGRRMASITKIPDAGHLVAQEKPYELAQAIWTMLNREYAAHGTYEL
ncbi:hypothetical protein FB451DRAFT_1170737 [Mycena latifolia]|nr:hypothetical protein FB451DRAFT_1170737 [Mycena latifolia]